MDTLIKEAEQLQYSAAKRKTQLESNGFAEATKHLQQLGRLQFTNRAVLRGHLSKIYAMQWSSDSKNIVSASQDGKMIIWNAQKNFKSAWVMTCAYAPQGNFVSCGGLDNVCSVYSLKSREGNARLIRILSGHDAFVACARFVDEETILTASGDKTCFLWDIERGKPKTKFLGHTGGVMSVSLSPTDTNTFLSGGCDCSAKLWDIRTSKCVQSFPGHKDDINDVKYFPSGQAFVSASDDGTCIMFDLASCKQLATYEALSNDCETEITSIDFSVSGRLLFAGDNAYNCTIWDSLLQERVGVIAGHSQRVSCLGVARDGTAICTGSWDGFLKIWN